NKRIIILYFLFFFSSRRRHTRFSRDWSSDVCSSDLTQINKEWISDKIRFSYDSIKRLRINYFYQRKNNKFIKLDIYEIFKILKRSEERRVGKECKYEWMQYH